MKNLLTVLKKLGKKMTSQDINGTNLVTVVDDIANKYTGGGGSGGSGVLVATEVDGTLDKTWQEIFEADITVISVVIDEIKLADTVTRVEYNSAADQGEQYFISTGGGSAYYAPSANGYPAIR